MECCGIDAKMIEAGLGDNYLGTVLNARTHYSLFLEGCCLEVRGCVKILILNKIGYVCESQLGRVTSDLLVDVR